MKRFVVLVLVVSLPLLAMDETVLVRMVREASLSLTGASRETQQEVVAQFRSQTFLQPITVRSAVITTMDPQRLIVTQECTVGGRMVRLYFLSPWYAGFFSLQASGQAPPTMSCAEWERNAQTAGFRTQAREESFVLAEDQPVRILIAQKEYQDRTFYYAVIFPQRYLRDLRQGQKISFDGKLISVDYKTPTNYTIVVTTTEVRPETTMLKCAQGHEYAPSAGYKFCPLDGTPLK